VACGKGQRVVDGTPRNLPVRARARRCARPPSASVMNAIGGGRRWQRWLGWVGVGRGERPDGEPVTVLFPRAGLRWATRLLLPLLGARGV
jgi:hypothetical protein